MILYYIAGGFVMVLGEDTMRTASEIKSYTCHVMGLPANLIAVYMTINKKGSE